MNRFFYLYKKENHQTMEEENAYELVIDFAKNHQLKYSTKDDSKHNVLLPGEAYSKTKFVVIKKNDLYFIAYYSHSSRSKGKSFSGIYGEVNFDKSVDFRVFQKDWIDRFVLFGKKKFGKADIDKKLTLTSRSNKIPKDFFSLKMANAYLDFNKKLLPIQIVSEYDYMPIIKALHNKMIVGLESNRWLYKPEELVLIFNEGYDLLTSIIKRANAQSCSI